MPDMPAPMTAILFGAFATCSNGIPTLLHIVFDVSTVANVYRMKENDTSGDLLASGLRILFMLATIDPIEDTMIRSSVRPRTRWGETGKSAGKQFVPQQERRVESPEDWLNHVERIRDHKDQNAFAELFRHFAPRIKAFLMKSGSDAAVAEECAQEVMATLWRKAHMFDPTRASVATWIFTIARNQRIDAFRKQRRPEPEELTWGPEAEPEQEEVLTLQQESRQLHQALQDLPDVQRDLIERAYFGDLSHSEIAKITGLPLGTIKSRIRLALERLRHSMR
jgi:RNA polymerase sigma factor (sigma-70 family)